MYKHIYLIYLIYLLNLVTKCMRKKEHVVGKLTYYLHKGRSCILGKLTYCIIFISPFFPLLFILFSATICLGSLFNLFSACFDIS